MRERRCGGGHSPVHESCEVSERASDAFGVVEGGGAEGQGDWKENMYV